MIRIYLLLCIAFLLSCNDGKSVKSPMIDSFASQINEPYDTYRAQKKVYDDFSSANVLRMNNLDSVKIEDVRIVEIKWLFVR